MNIIIFTDTFLPKIDGVAVSVENFTRILSSRGHNFTICCPRYGKDDVTEIGDRIKIVRFGNLPLPSYPDIKLVLPSLKKLREAMTAFDPDLVHVQSPGLMGQYGVLAARYYDVPLIGTYHTLVSEQATYLSPARLLKMDRLMDYYRKKIRPAAGDDKNRAWTRKTRAMKIIQWMTNWFYERDMLIISPSHLIKKTLEEQGVRTPIEVVSNGMDLAVFKGGIKLAPSADPRLLHVGRISFEKNCDVVLRSFALVLRDFPSATLDIVGDGPALQSLRILARELGIERVVRFHGFISRDRLPRMYPQYDLFVTASTMETQGLVVLEAVASGLPCVGVDAYALPELIHHGENGYIARPFDHEEMGRYTVSLLKNRALYRAFSKRSLQIASGHEIHRCAMKLERVYESCLRLEAVA